MKKPPFKLRKTAAIGVILFAAFLVGSNVAYAQSTDTAYYWVIAGPTFTPVKPNQSFVIAVNSARAAEIDAIFSNHGRAGFGGRIAAGTASYNKDYYSADHHVWNWYVASIEGIFDFNTTLFPECECPYLIAHPSDIAANPDEWIRQNGDRYTPKYYSIVARIDPSKRDAMANVSNRGLTGAGEKTLITGFIVTGGEPRNVVVRALGPSLTAAGVQQVAANPKIELYGASGHRGPSNADWKTDSRATELSQKYPSLVPTNDKEAAMLLTLLPGAYTLQGINEDGTEGIMLLEAYDVDSTSQ